MITATDTLTDRLCNNPSARIGLTTTSNIFANTISAAYNFSNQFHVTSSLTLNSAHPTMAHLLQKLVQMHLSRYLQVIIRRSGK